MRFIAYITAVLVAAGTIFVLGNVPNSDTERMALSVPGMQCAFGCYPTVKESLEKCEGVRSVELAKQESEEELTDKRVFVTHTSAFNLQQALAGLKDAGFEATRVAEVQAPESPELESALVESEASETEDDPAEAKTKAEAPEEE